MNLMYPLYVNYSVVVLVRRRAFTTQTAVIESFQVLFWVENPKSLYSRSTSISVNPRSFVSVQHLHLRQTLNLVILNMLETEIATVTRSVKKFLGLSICSLSSQSSSLLLTGLKFLFLLVISNYGSGVLELSIAKAYESDEECVKHLNYIPDGAKTFELVAKFCYTMKLELMASYIIILVLVHTSLRMISVMY
ncbi:unnamed protein product [Trifolium pratense]|uniref:Uncharacterized protein n=1 Tax=Trifolium pratense TaxID=57577 RepID=A0ACB0K7R2_TRIPR|nr:unnamed protein product [Trifolium pratense]